MRSLVFGSMACATLSLCMATAGCSIPHKHNSARIGTQCVDRSTGYYETFWRKLTPANCRPVKPHYPTKDFNLGLSTTPSNFKVAEPLNLEPNPPQLNVKPSSPEELPPTGSKRAVHLEPGTAGR